MALALCQNGYGSCALTLSSRSISSAERLNLADARLSASWSS